MKLIKKIAVIMLSVLMVLGMASVVSAEGAGTTAATGTIEIGNAISGQKYTIYKLLDLESYDEANNLYSYKPATTEWDEFFRTGDGKDYVEINANGYVTWKAVAGEDSTKMEARAAELAQKALAYADKTNGVNPVEQKEATGEGSTVTFDNLNLGYYLVESSVGALCGLTTTNNEVTIAEKNGVPSVEKKVYNGNDYSTSNYANIGDTVTFLINVFVKKGAQNYKVYDKMSDGFKLIESSISTIHIDSYPNTVKIEPADYTVTVDADKKGFQVEFTNTFLEKYKDQEYRIDIAYAATLTGDAAIGNSGNTNKAWLTYGDNNKSNESETKTYTFGIPVFKYTKDGETKKELAGAKFSLYSDAACQNIIDLIKSGTGEVYRRFINGDAEANKVTVITTNNLGVFNITGLNAGTYYLKEIEAPKGYNKLNNAITVIIEKATDGAQLITLFQDGSEVNRIEVENKSGTILPSTGGMGTTVIYLAGALLVMISGVVLIAKKRASQK